MKSLLRHFPRALLLLAATAVLLPGARAQDEDGSTARAKFSNAAKPGTLKLALPWAETRITGTDGDEIVVTSSLDRKGRSEVDSDGFRRLDEDLTFDLVEKDNVATIVIVGDNRWAAHGAEFEIQVPRNTNLVIRTEAGGDIEVDGVEGDLDINSMNGEIELLNIASSAVVNSMNGEISAHFKHAPVKPVSLSSMNGEIDVTLPGDTKANLRMRSHTGSIRTNFPDRVLQTKTEKVSRHSSSDSDSNSDSSSNSNSDGDTQREMAREQARLQRDHAKAVKDATKAAMEAARAAVEVHANVNIDGDTVTTLVSVPPVPPIPPVPGFGGKSIVGTLNGGGVDIKITTMNGAITLRQAK